MTAPWGSFTPDSALRPGRFDPAALIVVGLVRGAAPVLFVLGVMNGLLISKAKIHSFIVTLGMQFVIKANQAMTHEGAEVEDAVFEAFIAALDPLREEEHLVRNDLTVAEADGVLDLLVSTLDSEQLIQSTPG